MGFEAENEARKRAFADWMVDADMMRVGARRAVHALPARPSRRGGLGGSDRRTAERRVGRSREQAARAKSAARIPRVRPRGRLTFPELPTMMRFPGSSFSRSPRSSPLRCVRTGVARRPIKFVMSAPAGSSIDVLGRTIADKLKDRLGQPVIVENKPAAGGTVAVGETAKAPADGYTMVLAFNGPLSIAPLLQKLPYDLAEGPRAGHHHDEPAQRARGQRAGAREGCEGARGMPRPIRGSSTTRRSAPAARRN